MIKIHIFQRVGIYLCNRDSKGGNYEDLLFNEDIEVIKELQTKQIGTESLKHLFSRINRNPRFKQTEKEYLKKY
jgi:hypothetical protein